VKYVIHPRKPKNSSYPLFNGPNAGGKPSRMLKNPTFDGRIE